MNEEIALRLLMLHDYQPAMALFRLETSQMSASYEVVQLVNQMTQSDPKAEFIGYLIKLEELALISQENTLAKAVAKGRK